MGVRVQARPAEPLAHLLRRFAKAVVQAGQYRDRIARKNRRRRRRMEGCR